MASNLVSLGSLCSFENGDRGSNYPKECDYIDIGIPFISGSALNDGEIVRTGLKYISKEKFASLRAGKAHKGDILFSLRGSLGKCVISPFDESAIASALVIIRPNNNIDRDYLYFALNSPYFMRQCSNYDNGSIQANLSVEAIKTFDIPLPSFSIQRKIAKILKHINNKIENNNAISAQLESLAKTIYDYWFLQFEFPNKDGKPYKSSGGKMVWNEELKREIPEGWEVNELCKVFDITMGSSPKGESLNENHEGIEFYQGSTDFGDLYPIQRVYTTAPVRLAKAQDILISVRAPVGDMNIAMNDCCIGRGLAAVHYRSSLYTWNTLLTLKPYFDILNGAGTTFGALTSDGLKQQRIVKPSNNIIEKYISRISKIELKLRTITIENQQLTSLRDFLLPLLMNGQVTFKDGAVSEEK